MYPRRSAIPTLLVLLGASFLTGCFSDPAAPVLDPGAIQPTLSSIQEHVFSTTCAVSGCHAPPDPQLDLDLSAGQAYSHLVGIASAEQPSLNRITAGDAAASYLFLKITGDPRILGERMPRGGTPLSTEQIQAIQEWIDAGAADN